jgi:integrase
MTTQTTATTTTTKGGAKKNTTMDDGIRKPRGPKGKWGFVIDLRAQPAQRCRNPKCSYLAANERSAGFRHWTNGYRLDACPHCGGPLRETQERRLCQHGGYATKGEAVMARDIERAKYHRGGVQAPLRMTVAQYLGEVWLPIVRADDLKTTTRESYEEHVSRHLIGPASRPFPLGTTQLRDLTTKAVKEHYAMLAEGYVDWAPKRDPKTRRKVLGADGKPVMELRHMPGLGGASIRRIHATLHRALNIAIERRLLETNPAMGAARKLPALAKAKGVRRIEFWNPNELQRFLDFVEAYDGERGMYYSLWFVLSHTGIRRGEVAGLRWEDFDAAAGTLRIQRNRVPLKNGTVEETTPKTKGSIRTLELDPETVEVLDKRQRTAQMRAHLAAGPQWTETGYIFNDATGAPLHPNSITWQFRFARELANRLARTETPPAIELSPLAVHGLRHTFATIGLQAGMPITVVSKYLGHSSVTMTLNVYSHVMRGAQQELANTVADVIRRGAF